ncbi:MAG: hypothetical protein GX793_08675 [Bacteroidales bacterium]|nr:hypothetical protein [Bacteroidales bacterium]
MLLSFCLFLSPVFAQGVSINTDGSQAHESAILDIESTSSGILFPRMTTIERDNISNPAHSLMIFNTTTDCFEAYNSDIGQWTVFGCIGEEPEPEFTCGDNFTDYRDNKTYTSVKIGNQCWMKKNLNYETSNSLCYNNISNNCDLYGRLYTWDEAMAGATSSTSNPSGVQGVCPEGWHLPSEAEWTQLTNYVFTQTGWLCEVNLNLPYDYFIAKALAGCLLWKTDGILQLCAVGTSLLENDKSGFSGLPGGVKTTTFEKNKEEAQWWTATQTSGGVAKIRGLAYDKKTILGDTEPPLGSAKTNGLSVRCIKD